MAFTAINDPSAHFQTALYNGNGGANTITNDGNANLQADWLWFKERSSTSSHHLFDTSRGVGGSGKAIYSNNSDAESADTALTSVNTDGFTLANTGGFNENGQTNICWQWKANGGTTSSNSSGSITSTVQANTTAGFSIVTYTGTGSNATVGHGLGVAPAAIIVKNRSATQSWIVAHQRHPAGFNDASFLDLQNAKDTDSGYWNNTNPTTTVFSVGTNAKCNGNGNNLVAYCFAQKQGFSNFSSYIGNGSTDGQFIYTGFKPAWVMIKNVEQSKNWYIFDNKRLGFNPIKQIGIQANDNTAETSGSSEYIDLLSNGFKLRENFSHTNSDGFRYIYFAFADNPFTSSAGVPTTAF